MQYLTMQDLYTYIDAGTLDAITGGDNTLLDKIELQAAQDMKAYINVRYDADALFGNMPEVVKMYLVDILLYHLHSRISPDHIPQLRIDRYNEAVKWLEKIAGGFINPDWPAKDDKTGKPIRFGSGPKQSFYF